MQVIIFNNSGGVGIITPAQNTGLSIIDIASKDVPAGAAFEIVDDSVLPWDKPRESWEWV